jgi:guanylate kinase
MKTIITITGESGTGKTTMAEYIRKKMGINMIESYTDRAKRTPDEVGHTFLTKEEYDKIKLEDMIAFTNFGGNRYCCIKQDVENLNTYVIDESGIKYLTKNFSDEYQIIKVRIKRDYDLRKEIVNEDRLKRDEGQFTLPDDYYDIVLHNNYSTEQLETNINNILEHIINTYDVEI